MGKPVIEETLAQLADAVLAGGLYPQVAPEGVAKPYGVYSLVAGIPQNTLSDGEVGRQDVFQIDVFGTTYLSAKGAAEALADAIQGAFQDGSLQGVRQSIRSLYEPEVRLHRFIQEYSFWS